MVTATVFVSPQVRKPLSISRWVLANDGRHPVLLCASLYATTPDNEEDHPS